MGAASLCCRATHRRNPVAAKTFGSTGLVKRDAEARFCPSCPHGVVYLSTSEQLYPNGFPEATTVPSTGIFFSDVPNGETRINWLWPCWSKIRSQGRPVADADVSLPVTGNLLPSVNVTVWPNDAVANAALAGATCEFPELPTNTRRYGSPVAGSRPNAELISFSALLAAIMSPNANAAAHTNRTATPMRVPFIPASSIVADGVSVNQVRACNHGSFVTASTVSPMLTVYPTSRTPAGVRRPSTMPQFRRSMVS